MDQKRLGLTFGRAISLGLMLLPPLMSAGCLRSGDDAGSPAERRTIRSGPTRTGRLGHKPRVVTRKLTVPFLLLNGGKLAVGVPEGVIPGDPLEAYERLFLISGTRAVLVNDLAALGGRVGIRTPKEAVAFCRLRTSPVTYHLLDKGTVEVVSREQVDTDFCFGDRKLCALLRKSNSGMLGIVHSAAQMVRYGVKPQSAHVISGGFEVRRTLLEGNAFDTKSGYYVIRTRELVTREGGYRLLSSSKRPAPNIPGVSWVIPVLM